MLTPVIRSTARSSNLSWGLAMGACDTGWIGAMGLIYGCVPWGYAAWAGSGRLDWFMGMRHGGAWLDRFDGIDWWGWAMGARDTGWIREMGLIHGGMRHWLDRDEGIDSCGHAMGPCYTAWIGAMGFIHGGTPWGRATLAGLGRWVWLMVLMTLAGLGWWDWFMGVRDTGWNGAMALIYGDVSWGHVTGLGRWDSFVGARHGGATLAGCGAMGLSYGGDGLEPKGGGRARGRSIATGLGRKPVGGCYSAEMRRPAIRSTAHTHAPIPFWF